jgi:hypothetical protein
MITLVEICSGIYNKNKYQHISVIYSYIAVLTASFVPLMKQQNANNKGDKSFMP